MNDRNEPDYLRKNKSIHPTIIIRRDPLLKILVGLSENEQGSIMKDFRLNFIAWCEDSLSDKLFALAVKRFFHNFRKLRNQFQDELDRDLHIK